MTPTAKMIMTMGASALMLAATKGQAQTRTCAPHDRVIAHLAENYSETRHMLGLAANDMVVELFASPDSGTWTITVTRPDGVTCLVASGTDAQLMAEALPNTDPDA